MRWLHVKTDGTVVIRQDYSYEALCEAVGGDLEAAPTPPGLPATAYINEEGKFINGGLPHNATMTALLRPALIPGDWIAGDAVVIGLPDGDGEDTPVPASVEARVHEVAWVMRPLTGSHKKA